MTAHPTWVFNDNQYPAIFTNTADEGTLSEVRVLKTTLGLPEVQIVFRNIINLALFAESRPALPENSGIMLSSVGTTLYFVATTPASCAFLTEYVTQLKDAIVDFTPELVDRVVLHTWSILQPIARRPITPAYSMSSQESIVDANLQQLEDESDWDDVEELLFLEALSNMDYSYDDDLPSEPPRTPRLFSLDLEDAITASYLLHYYHPENVPTPPSVNAGILEEHQYTKRVYKRFICGISGQIMDKPMFVHGIAGHYNEAHIKQWIELKGTHPLTRAKMTMADFVHDEALQQQIDSFMNGVKGEGLRRSERLENKRQKLN